MERVLGLLIVQVGWIKTYASMDYYIYFITKLCYYRLWGVVGESEKAKNKDMNNNI